MRLSQATLRFFIAVEASHACVVMRVQNIGPLYAGENEHSDEVRMEGGVYVTNVENVLLNVVLGLGDNAD